ncbi:major tail protein [Alkaliphilus transvaalensis]|uniref:major tail protein n=1 Tax=Alkaliphilus transvaalensis TaxID=114628 RepID=UPI0004791566|nr:major tail protein [Alkaliphilus transvaalensis]
MAQVGLKDLHFAVLEEDTREGVLYGEIKPLAGAMNATINPTVNTQELYADDQLWESVSALGKIDVEVETADIPLSVRGKLTGSEVKDGVLIEKATDKPPHVALGFKSQKSDGKYRYVWLLKGVAQPMAEDYSTKKDNVEHKTPRLKFVFMPRAYDGEWKRTADEGTPEFTGAESWFQKVPGDALDEGNGEEPDGGLGE